MGRLRILLAEKGPDLFTRDQGAPVRRRLRRMIEAGDQLEIEFAGVRTITPSYADEVLGRLLLEIGPERFRSSVRLKAEDPVVRRLVNAVLARRKHEFEEQAKGA